MSGGWRIAIAVTADQQSMVGMFYRREEFSIQALKVVDGNRGENENSELECANDMNMKETD